MCRNNYSVENLGAYSEPGQTSKMEHFAKRINGVQGSTTLLKNWKRNSDTGVFLWVLPNFKEHLFYCTPPLAHSEHGSIFNNAKVLKLYKNFMSPQTILQIKKKWRNLKDFILSMQWNESVIPYWRRKSLSDPVHNIVYFSQTLRIFSVTLLQLQLLFIVNKPFVAGTKNFVCINFRPRYTVQQFSYQPYIDLSW